MSGSERGRFAATVVVGTTIAFALAAVLTPPDPFSQMLAAAILLVVVLPLAYYLTYRGGYASISNRMGR